MCSFSAKLYFALCFDESLHVSPVCAGNFFSAAFENTCLALVGASGGVFGMVGLFIADMIVNFGTIKR